MLFINPLKLFYHFQMWYNFLDLVNSFAIIVFFKMLIDHK